MAPSMPLNRRAGVSRLLEAVGGTLLEVLCDGGDLSRDIDSLVIHDPTDEPAVARGALVLGVGMHEPQQIVALVDGLGRSDAAGLVLRTPRELTPEIEAAARRGGVVLLGTAPGTSWTRLAALLPSVLAHDDLGAISHETLGGVPSGDLFALANAIAALLDAPVTIEDRRFRVLAFSGRQDETDESRIGAIINREVSLARAQELERRGKIRELYSADGPVLIDPPASGLPGFTVPRVVLPVRAGDEILGSIWAAVREPLSAERMQTFRDIGPLAALHMLRERAGADVERRIRADLVATALEGGAAASEAAARLGIDNQPVIVLAYALDPRPAEVASPHADQVAVRRRMADAFAMHLTVAAPGSAAALVGDVAYGIVLANGPAEAAERNAVRLANEFLRSTGKLATAAIGVGAVVSGTPTLARSREGADRALRVVRSKRTSRRVACIKDVAMDALLMDFGAMLAARDDELSGPVARLVRYDAQHRTELVDTLRAWLDAFGNVNDAADAMHVHPNTFRYRLRRLVEIGDVDLADSDTRMSLMLQLRLLAEE